VSSGLSVPQLVAIRAEDNVTPPTALNPNNIFVNFKFFINIL
jgi:hypothetical protein